MALWRSVPRILPSTGTLARYGAQVSTSRNMSEGSRKEKLYELRTYTVYPDKMRDYLTITAEEFHLRTAHSKVVGFWTSEIGGLNQVVHIWEYDSLAHRAGVRAKLGSDPEWLSRYISRVAPMWQQQDNSLMTLMPGTTLASTSGKGVYEIQIVNLQGGGWTSSLEEYVKSCRLGKGAEAVVGSCVVGAWRGVLGSTPSAVLLWRHEGPDAVVGLKEVLDQLAQDSGLTAHIGSIHSKLLLPHAVSPLQ